MNINTNSTDAQIRRYLRQKKRRRMRIRVASRLGVMAVIFLMMIYLIVSGIQQILVPETHAADTSTGQDVRGTIFIDAGHGGEDPGAEALGRTEKDDTLTVALAVRKSLKNKGFKVVMSRTKDVTLVRSDRGKMANKAGAGLMVSIHRNKATAGQGVEMWIPSENGKKDQLLANNIMTQMEKVGITANRGVRSGTLPDPSDDYVENSVSDMPSVLIEFGFISDEEDNKLFDTKTSEYADAVAEGISETYQSLYESGSGGSGE